MGLRDKQSQFLKYTGMLFEWAYSNGYELTYGDAWARDGHSKGSFHYQRLAVDLNLFRDGVYLRSTVDHAPLGMYWKSLHQMCTWGGDFKRKDGNHYSWGEK